MGKEIVYCDICSAQIVGDEFAKGRAVTVLNRHFCSKCRAQAPAPAPTPNPAAGPRPAVRHPTDRAVTPLPRPRTPTPTPRPRPRTTKVATVGRREGVPRVAWIALGIGGGVLLLALLLFQALAKGGQETPPLTPAGPGQAGTPPAPSPEEQAQEFVQNLERELAALSQQPEEALRRLEQARTEMMARRWTSTAAYQSLEARGPPIQQAIDRRARENQAREILGALRTAIEADAGNLDHLDAIERAQTDLEALGEEGRLPRAALPELRRGVVEAAGRALRDRAGTVRQEVEADLRNDLETMADDRVDRLERALDEFEHRTGEPLAEIRQAVAELRRLVREAGLRAPEETPGETASDRVEEPPVGEWFALLSDPLERVWTRARDADMSVWQLEGGVLLGRRTPGGNQAGEFLSTRWDRFEALELEFNLKLEGIGMIAVLGRMNVRFEEPQPEWTACRFVLQGGRFTGTVGARTVSDSAQIAPGPIRLALAGNTRVQIRNLRVKRLP